MVHLWILFNSSTFFFCAEVPWTGCSTAGCASQGQSRGVQSPQSPCWLPLFWWSRGHHLAFRDASAHCWLISNPAFCPPRPPGLLSTNSSPSLHKHRRLLWPRCNTWHCQTSLGSCEPTFQASPGPSGLCPFLLLDQLHHSTCCYLTEGLLHPTVFPYTSV